MDLNTKHEVYKIVTPFLFDTYNYDKWASKRKFLAGARSPVFRQLPVGLVQGKGIVNLLTQAEKRIIFKPAIEVKGGLRSEGLK